MSTILPILIAAACPLGMVAMGGVAWAAAKRGRGHDAHAPGEPRGEQAQLAR